MHIHIVMNTAYSLWNVVNATQRTYKYYLVIHCAKWVMCVANDSFYFAFTQQLTWWPWQRFTFLIDLCHISAFFASRSVHRLSHSMLDRLIQVLTHTWKDKILWSLTTSTRFFPLWYTPALSHVPNISTYLPTHLPMNPACCLHTGNKQLLTNMFTHWYRC